MASPIPLLLRRPRKVGGEVPSRASSHVPPRLLWSWVVGGRHPREVASDCCGLLSPQELGLLQDYLLALTTDDHLLRCAAQVLPPPRPPPPLPPPRPGAGSTPGLHGALFPVSHFLLVSQTAAEPHLSVSFTVNRRVRRHQQEFVSLKPKQPVP